MIGYKFANFILQCKNKIPVLHDDIQQSLQFSNDCHENGWVPDINIDAQCIYTVNDLAQLKLNEESNIYTI